MFVMSPGDNKVQDSKSDTTDGRFGGNRKVTSDVQNPQDYTKSTLDGRDKVENPEDTTKDIDDLNDPQARKRENSRRAETSTVGADNQYRRSGDGDDKIYSEPDNLPTGEGREDDVVIEPEAGKKHGTRSPWHIGESRDRPGDQNVAPSAR